MELLRQSSVANVLIITLQTAILLVFITSIHGNCSQRINSPTCILTKTLPSQVGHCYVKGCRDGTFMPSVGNGFVATVIMSDEIHAAGIYNGKAYVKPRYGWPVYYYQHTHRARIPSSVAINFTVVGDVGENTYALDVQVGVYYRWFVSNDVNITQRIYAHREQRSLMVVELSTEVKAGSNATIVLHNNAGNKSRDINFSIVNDSTIPTNANVVTGKINTTETESSARPTIAKVWSKIPDTISATGKETFYFITAISSTLDSKDPLKSALESWNMAMKNPNKLFQSHKNAWNKLWQRGKITMEGDFKLSQTVSTSIYYILSSTRHDWIYGLSPGGLPGGEEYLGHTFWDQDIWMYPPILMLHNDLGKASVTYRYKRLTAAEKIAEKYHYKGAMFPWESAYTGYEVCPGEIYGKNQNHITGDIAFAVKQYWMATGDVQWMKDEGFQIVYETAKFWISRAKYEGTKQRYVIDDVMPPDEYNYPANNSVYTNIVAKININFALELGKLLGRHVPTGWRRVADGLFIPFDKVNNYHPEFEGFKMTDKVKQADAILIGYPLMYEMSKEVRKNDLIIYGNITNPKGPAMTHSMFSIGWLEIDETEKAALALYKNYGNIIGPFHVWSEIIGGKGATNFITAAGGFLQAVMFGYGGLRLKSDGLHFRGQLPPKVSKMSFDGLDYQGNAIDIYITEDNLMLNVTQQSATAKKLVLLEGGRIVTLIPGKLYNVKSKQGIVSVFKTKKLTSSAPSTLDRILTWTLLPIAFMTHQLQ